MTIPQAAAAGLLNESALRTLVREEKIPSLNIGNRVYINFDVAREMIYRMSATLTEKEPEANAKKEERSLTMSIIPDRFYTSSEVREILRIGRSTYYRLIKNGELPHMETEGKYFVRGEDLLRYIEDRMVR